jgi:hypothetical protein
MMKKSGNPSTPKIENSDRRPQFESSESSADNLTQPLQPPPSGRDPIRLFQIEVKAQGCRVAEHIIAAGNALEAINLVETEYGEPVQVDSVLVENEDGSLHQVLAVKNWHGFTFDARVIKSQDKSIFDL